MGKEDTYEDSNNSSSDQSSTSTVECNSSSDQSSVNSETRCLEDYEEDSFVCNGEGSDACSRYESESGFFVDDHDNDVSDDDDDDDEGGGDDWEEDEEEGERKEDAAKEPEAWYQSKDAKFSDDSSASSSSFNFFDFESTSDWERCESRSAKRHRGDVANSMKETSSQFQSAWKGVW